MPKPSSQHMSDEQVLDRSILLIRHGSHAYGLNIETSDVDEKGVCVPYLDHYFGLANFEQKDKGWRDGKDRVIYELRKFCRLALSCNPNIIEFLYVHPEDILKISEWGKRLIGLRDSFLSTKALGSFSGYALHQLKKLKNKENYDTKDAMHLLRLTRMCKEIVTTGQVNVRRPDRAYLLQVRAGQVNIDEVVKEAEDNFQHAKLYVEKSPLPDKPDFHQVEIFLEECIGALAKRFHWD